ncbi:MAG: hypothetical protein WAN46_21645 [Gammaproteobacteria bacterium]
MAKARRKRAGFAICVKNDGYEASLERRKIYEVLNDSDAAAHQQVRIIDESGEDYLFPAEFFVSIELPKRTERAVIEAA